MKIETYNTGKSYRKLWGGLELTLTPYKQGWQLTLRRENTKPSKNEYRIISKAFFDSRIKHLNQPDENSLEIKTQ